MCSCLAGWLHNFQRPATSVGFRAQRPLHFRMTHTSGACLSSAPIIRSASTLLLVGTYRDLKFVMLCNHHVILQKHRLHLTSASTANKASQSLTLSASIALTRNTQVIRKEHMAFMGCNALGDLIHNVLLYQVLFGMQFVAKLLHKKNMSQKKYISVVVCSRQLHPDLVLFQR